MTKRTGNSYENNALNHRKPEVTRLATLNTATKILELTGKKAKDLDSIVGDVIGVASVLESWVLEVVEDAPKKATPRKPSPGLRQNNRGEENNDEPTRKQLEYLARLCEEKGFDYDEVVAAISSKREASETIEELISRLTRPK